MRTKLFLPNSYLKIQSGQTLIETLVAIFMLVMGVSAAVGLAIYAFNSSTGITKQIIATGLAREGVEAIKNMRDTNWLKTSVDTDCFDYQTAASNAKCHKTWLKPPGVPGSGKGYDIGQPLANKSLRLTIDPAAQEVWSVKDDNVNWGLNFDPSLTCSSGTCGFYTIPNINTGLIQGSSDYFRKLVITEDSGSPFDHTEYHRLKLRSLVWWIDRKCPYIDDWDENLGKIPNLACRVEIDMNLTNWKDY